MIPNFEDFGLLVIDVQEKLVPAMPTEVVEQVISNIDILADLTQQLGGSLFYTEQYPRGLGPTVEPLRARLKGAMRCEKVSFSCLGEPTFLEQVLEHLPSNLIVVGMEAHVCVLLTIFDLVVEDEEQERTLFVPSDAVCSRKKLHWQNSLDQLYEANAVVTNTETLVFQALGAAGGDHFKHFSRRLR